MPLFGIPFPLNEQIEEPGFKVSVIRGDSLRRAYTTTPVTRPPGQSAFAPFEAQKYAFLDQLVNSSENSPLLLL